VDPVGDLLLRVEAALAELARDDRIEHEVSPLAPSASSTGRCCGSAPAMTALGDHDTVS
jgi:hypothetical protein